MTGNIVTQPTAAETGTTTDTTIETTTGTATTIGSTAAPAVVLERPARTARGVPLSQSRAARELGLKRREFDLAVHLGSIRTLADDGGGPRVVPAEIDRLRAEDGFPETLKERVRMVGTAEGAALLEVTSARFTRLARLGRVTPVDYYLNRYAAVVWLYRAAELREFAADEKSALLLSGRTPEHLRDLLDAGLDLRPRTWRGRRLAFWLDRARDPWARAAALASFLDPVRIAELVRDPYERAYVNRLRPARPAHGTLDSPAALTTVRITTADDPDEIARLRTDLRQALAEAREHRPAPRPAIEAREVHEASETGEAGEARDTSETREASGAPRERRGLLGRLRRRKP
ncbi:DUF6397 family protein [Streptomyces sp. CRN 30]|uniref:DUF6397 family protein n=1 Tax=Streptomyces sp. CRN 30 TaxID=3075613 RepID=UPI002A808FD9|nr:DUF6397 family protein [Streptomyces sp. CRN 30]